MCRERATQTGQLNANIAGVMLGGLVVACMLESILHINSNCDASSHKERIVTNYVVCEPKVTDR